MTNADTTAATLACLVRRSVSDVDPLGPEEAEHLERLLGSITAHQFENLAESFRGLAEAATDDH